MYQSKYYTCEEIDERLLKGYYDDAVSKGYTGTLDQMAAMMASENYIDLRVVYPKIDFTLNTALDKVNEVVSPLNTGFKFAYVDTHINRLLIFEYLSGDSTKYTSWACVSKFSISLAQLNSDWMGSYITYLINTPYNRSVLVRNDDITLGILDFYATDKLITFIIDTNLVRSTDKLSIEEPGEGVDYTQLHRYYRQYNYTDSDIVLPDGTTLISKSWTTWKEDKPAPVLLTPDEYEAISEKDSELTYFIYEDE